MSVTISEAVKYIGVDDKTIDLFESQYVVPHGVSYNSYLIFDEKVALMDTVDARGMESTSPFPPRQSSFLYGDPELQPKAHPPRFFRS